MRTRDEQDNTSLEAMKTKQTVSAQPCQHYSVNTRSTMVLFTPAAATIQPPRCRQATAERGRERFDEKAMSVASGRSQGSRRPSLPTAKSGLAAESSLTTTQDTVSVYGGSVHTE